jgi:phosphoheptose isomerase
MTASSRPWEGRGRPTGSPQESATRRTPMPTGRRHVAALLHALQRVDTDRLDRWGGDLARRLTSGGRLLVAGNGGSAAQAQHLTAELVGRYRDDRQPLSAIALHAETSSLTAIGNDYDFSAVFARQVRAHGRPGDVFLGLSTSGSSSNIVEAAHAARDCGLVTWALTGPSPNPLDALCDDALAVEAMSTATVQEVHLVAIHLICAAVDVALGVAPADVDAVLDVTAASDGATSAASDAAR